MAGYGAAAAKWIGSTLLSAGAGAAANKAMGPDMPDEKPLPTVSDEDERRKIARRNASRMNTAGRTDTVMSGSNSLG